jgi:DNA-binding transcriptional MocR family regulator
VGVPSHLRNLADGNPDPALLPDLRPVLGRLAPRSRVYGGPTSRPALLRLAARELEEEGIPTGSLTVVGGALDGIERVLQARLRAGDRVAVEDPGYSAVFDLLAALGLVPEPVKVDDFGVVPAELARALESGISACILTPRAQNPTGAAYDAKRVRELRAVLDRHPEPLVVEDDHAGPVAGAPALTVVHAKRTCWAVVRSVSKSLGPDLRLAILAGDPLTVARVEGRRALGAGWVSDILQGIVEGLWSRAETARRLRAAEGAYTARRSQLLDALARRGIAAHGRSGFNVWVPVSEEAAVVARLAAAGWAVRAGERYRLKSPPAVRITIATLRADEAERLAEELASCLRPLDTVSTP